MHPFDFVADVPETSPPVSDRNLGNQGPQIAEKAADLVGIHRVADSDPGSHSMYWVEQQTLPSIPVHEPTCQSSHSGKVKRKAQLSRSKRPQME